MTWLGLTHCTFVTKYLSKYWLFRNVIIRYKIGKQVNVIDDYGVNNSCGHPSEDHVM